jgi:hypothetical protein
MRSVPLQLVKPLLAGRTLAAKVPPRFKDGAAWVLVAPFKERTGAQMRARLGPPTAEELAKEPWRYLVSSLEAPRYLIEGQYEISDEELHHLERYKVSTLAEVDDLLERLLGDPSKLKLLDDYPGDDPDYWPF